MHLKKNVKGTNIKNYQHVNKKKSITVLNMVNVTLGFRNMGIDKGNSKQTRSIWNVDIQKNDEEIMDNEEILEMTNSKRSLIATIKKRKLQYFGHLIRQNGIQRLLLEGKIEGKMCGRPRTMWMDNIKDWTGLKYGECVRRTKDRKEWRFIIANLLTVDGTAWWWWMWCSIITLLQHNSVTMTK